MGLEIPQLIKEIKEARQAVEGRDAKMAQRFAEIEKSVNDLFVRVGRPGGGESLGGYAGDAGLERKDAIGLCLTKHMLAVPKVDGVQPEYVPTSGEIDEALTAKKAISKLFRHADLGRLEQIERKSLSAFNFGNNGFILTPEMSSRVLSCLEDSTDIASLMHNEQISGPSIKYMLDNARLDQAAWACETSCFANNPQADLAAGLGELEIKAETLRFIACATSDLMQDSGFDIQGWLLRKVSTGFRNTISCALIGGDGIGKPQGILHPGAGIPICDTSPNTAAGTFTWQDLVMLAYQVPIQWHDGAAFLMNQKTLGLCLTMSDAAGRPVLLSVPITEGARRPAGARFSIAGFPVVVSTQMPDCQPGATPIAFGLWDAAYTVVNRKSTTMQPDPYSAGFCSLFKFEARVGGAVTCPGAARLLRVR
jgi:HK97 family phage major capsid protein